MANNNYPEEQVKLKKAWSVFVLSHMSYLSIFGNTFNVSFNCRSGGRTSINNNPRKFNQKKINMVAGSQMGESKRKVEVITLNY